MLKIFGLVILLKKEYFALEIKKGKLLKNFDKFIGEILLTGNVYTERKIKKR